MKQHHSLTQLTASLVALATIPTASAATTLLDDHFNDGTLSSNPGTGGGSVFLSNGTGTNGSVSESGSLARILDGTSTNTSGMRSSNAFDLSNSSLSYTTTWDVANWTSGASGGAERRTFFTLQSNNDWIFSTSNSEASRIILIIDELRNNAVFRYQNRSANSITNFDSSQFDLGTFAQDTDGFTATLVLDSTGFNFTTAGLAATNQVNLAGTWASLGTNFSTALGNDGPMYVTSFIQDQSTTGSSLDIDRITLTSVPEPSGLILLGLSCGLGAFVRRR